MPRSVIEYFFAIDAQDESLCAASQKTQIIRVARLRE